MQKRFLSLGILGILFLAACGRREEPSPQPSLGSAAERNPATPADRLLQDIPNPPGVAGFAVTGNERFGGASGRSGRSIDDVAEFYATELPAGGWFLVSSANRGAGRRLEFREDPRARARFLEIDLSPAEELPAGCAIRLAWGPVGDADPDMESYEPEPEEPADVDGGSPEW